MKFCWTTLCLVAVTSLGCANMGHDCHCMGKHDKKHEMKEKDEEDEGNEVKVTIDQVPPAVKATLMEAAEGNPVKSIDKEMHKDGKVVYETDVMINGKNMEIRVDPDGKLLSKKVDNEEDEHANHEKKGEKEDKD